MYCEKTQRECEFLDVLVDQRDKATLFRAVGDVGQADFADRAEVYFEETKQGAQELCSSEVCGVLRHVVQVTLFEDAYRIYKAEKEVNNGQ